jgi:hypothetical protein
MQLDFSDFKKPQVVVGFILAVIAGGGVMWTVLFYRLPDLERREDRQDKMLETKFTELSGSMDKQLAAVREDIHGQLVTLGLSVQGLKANVLLLCEQKRPLAQTCDVKALVAEVQKASQLQAQFFDTADVHLKTGVEPLLATASLKDQLPMFMYVSQANNATKADKPTIANAILWSSAADSAQWRQDGTTIVVAFANGTVRFDLAQPTTKEHVGDLVQSLNMSTEALKAAGSVAQERKQQSTP